MTDFAFETITPAQARTIGSADRVTVASGSARSTTVVFQGDGTLAITISDRSVVFGAAFGELARAGRLAFPDGSQLFVGGLGADSVTAGMSHDGLYGGDGTDTLDGGAGDDLLQGNMGADLLVGGRGRNTIYGGQDGDRIDAGDDASFAQGNRGDDSIVGGNAADTLLGGQGEDTIAGGDGENFINGNLGDDVISGVGSLFGEAGNDTLEGVFTGLALLDGGDGNDKVLGSGRLVGGQGNDTLGGRRDADTVEGGVGDDQVFGNDGDDLVLGGDGNDTIYASEGADLLAGGAGADKFDFTAFASRIAGSLVRIADWSSEDRMSFTLGQPFVLVGTPENYAEISASDFASARAAADGLVRAGKPLVAVQVGDDVVLFADLSRASAATNAIYLVGRSLADIAAGNIV